MSELESYARAGAAVLAAQEGPAGLAEHGSGGLLRFQKCDRCGYLRYPIAALCPECLETRAQWVTDPGDGSVWSFCVYHKAFHPGFESLVPYVVALVELDSGPRLITNLVGFAREAVHIGLRGRAAPKELPGGGSLIYFFPPTPGRP